MEIAASKAPGELLNWGDTQKMKLSWRVVQESMRLTPPVQVSFRVAQEEDISFDGFRIPKSWKVRERERERIPLFLLISSKNKHRA